MPLFDDVAVTWDDVAVWLRAVPQIDPESPRALAYIRLWNVADKIAHAKRTGQWPPQNVRFS